jgi:plastocyanin
METVRDRLLLLAAVVAALALAAFAISKVPGTGSAVATSSPVAPTPTPVAGATPGPDVRLSMLAMNLELRPPVLEVPAGAAFVIQFRNGDAAGMLHELDIRRADGSTVGDQSAIDGGSTTDYVYEALAPGDYVLICSVHPIPAMTGTLRAR